MPSYDLHLAGLQDLQNSQALRLCVCLKEFEKAHEWQVKYYLYVFEQNGIEGVTGLLEYPVLRKTQPVILSDLDREKIEAMKKDIEKIVSDENCPPLIQKSLCRNCSYFEFYYSKEVEE
jgi:CRISPR-associated exonuclease Cas4